MSEQPLIQSPSFDQIVKAIGPFLLPLVGGLLIIAFLPQIVL